MKKLLLILTLSPIFTLAANLQPNSHHSNKSKPSSLITFYKGYYEPTSALSIAKSLLGDSVEDAEWASGSSGDTTNSLSGTPIWIKRDGKWSFGYINEDEYAEILETEKGMYVETNIQSFLVNKEGIIDLSCYEMEESCSPKNYLDYIDDGDIIDEEAEPVAWRSLSLSIEGDSLIVVTEIHFFSNGGDSASIEDKSLLKNSMKIYDWRKNELVYSGIRKETFGAFYLEEKNNKFSVFLNDEYYSTVDFYEVLGSDILMLGTGKEKRYFDKQGKPSFIEITGELKYIKDDFYLDYHEKVYEMGESGEEEELVHANSIWSISEGLVIDSVRYRNEQWQKFVITEGLFWFEEDGLTGIVNMKGNIVFPAEILDVVNIEGSKVLVGINTKSGWGIINIKGEVLQPPVLSNSEMIAKGRLMMQDM